MIFVPLVLAASTPADLLAKARKEYAGCLSAYTTSATDKKMPREEFLAGLKTKCAKEETDFRAALAASDKADGMTPKEASEDADDQVSGYVEQMTDNFDSAG
ncbi:MAG: hypothetical protein AB7U35_01740 [Sphingobium sp.]